MRISILKHSLLFTFLFLLSLENQAQQNYSADVNNSKVLIKGTSNIHDWEMEVKSLKSEMKVSEDSIMKVHSITFNVPVKSMKSGKSSMDKNSYEALKAEEHEFIKFSSNAIKYLSGKYLATGDLIISGHKRQIEIPLQLSKQGDELSLSTSHKINMLDYEIEPPKALFGTVRTGKTVDVIINLTFNN